MEVRDMGVDADADLALRAGPGPLALGVIALVLVSRRSSGRRMAGAGAEARRSGLLERLRELVLAGLVGLLDLLLLLRAGRFRWALTRVDARRRRGAVVLHALAERLHLLAILCGEPRPELDGP